MPQRCCRIIFSRTVVLTRQFRLPAYLASRDDLMMGAAGMLDDETPDVFAQRRKRKSRRLHDVRVPRLMSPGAVPKLHFFVAEYDPRCALAAAAADEARTRGVELSIGGHSP
jgi:hypothetical protein